MQKIDNLYKLLKFKPSETWISTIQLNPQIKNKNRKEELICEKLIKQK